MLLSLASEVSVKNNVYAGIAAQRGHVGRSEPAPLRDVTLDSTTAVKGNQLAFSKHLQILKYSGIRWAPSENHIVSTFYFYNALKSGAGV